jgi:hypothetical protein
MLKRKLLSVCLFAMATSMARADLNVGDTAPKLEVDRWYNLPAGMKGIKQSDLKGKILMVEFWATW